MAEKQNLSVGKNMRVWIILALGLLVLGTALLSGCRGEKSNPEPANQQPESSIAAGQTAGAGDPAPQDPALQNSAAPAAPQEEPAAAQSQLSPEAANPGQQDTTPVPVSRDVTPVPQSSPPAAPEDENKPSGNGPAAGAAPAEEKTYSFKAGDYFPPFSLSGLNGNTYNSDALFAANKITLLNFWATFCGPCIREMPALEQLYQQYAEQGLGVTGIVLDSRKADTARTMAAKLGTTYPHLLDNGSFIRYIYSVPQTFLVDREGKILSTAIGARTLEQFTQMIQSHI
jgi:thiol-disulfide isomerase/thioredoxin